MTSHAQQKNILDIGEDHNRFPTTTESDGATGSACLKFSRYYEEEIAQTSDTIVWKGSYLYMIGIDVHVIICYPTKQNSCLNVITIVTIIAEIEFSFGMNLKDRNCNLFFSANLLLNTKIANWPITCIYWIIWNTQKTTLISKLIALCYNYIMLFQFGTENCFMYFWIEKVVLT